jgi:hypothetical protein
VGVLADWPVVRFVGDAEPHPLIAATAASNMSGVNSQNLGRRIIPSGIESR